MKRLRWSAIGAWMVWWAVLAVGFWLLGKMTGQPLGLAGSAAISALAIASGELGDRVRRRRKAKRMSLRDQAGEQA
ncbi:hypothetical protein PV396_36225 [Streptomyces sp. ME02-8801-2C]|uniref:hypothetical protein n=1 Tax=Streptomyces sp. ME02-8801-2C TaxID=3028680 RepID=UPI0029A7BECE|nr:hypothetical protein [Streptomyces sp. ME02-8801-2C]MDX3457344.1 hypothetical protein [Streptomyces sp. ME02-8801-2C]